MKAIQVISFLALMLGAGGIENQNGELQPAAIGIMIVPLWCYWQSHSKKKLRPAGTGHGANRE